MKSWTAKSREYSYVQKQVIAFFTMPEEQVSKSQSKQHRWGQDRELWVGSVVEQYPGRVANNLWKENVTLEKKKLLTSHSFLCWQMWGGNKHCIPVRLAKHNSLLGLPPMSPVPPIQTTALQYYTC